MEPKQKRPLYSRLPATLQAVLTVATTRPRWRDYERGVDRERHEHYVEHCIPLKRVPGMMYAVAANAIGLVLPSLVHDARRYRVHREMAGAGGEPILVDTGRNKIFQSTYKDIGFAIGDIAKCSGFGYEHGPRSAEILSSLFLTLGEDVGVLARKAHKEIKDRVAEKRAPSALMMYL